MSNRTLAVIGFLVIGLGLLELRRLALRDEKLLLENRAIVQEIGAANEKRLLDFMSRTVERCDRLQLDNPALEVPKVVEPLTLPHLRDDQMRR